MTKKTTALGVEERAIVTDHCDCWEDGDICCYCGADEDDDGFCDGEDE